MIVLLLLKKKIPKPLNPDYEFHTYIQESIMGHIVRGLMLSYMEL